MARSRHSHRSGLFDRPGPLLTVTGALLALGWIALVGSVHLHEMIVGAVVVALSVPFCALVYKSELLPIELRFRDVVQAWRIPWYILSGSAEIIWLLLKDLAGTPAESLYRVSGFRTGLRDPVAIERTALAIAYTTAAPNFIVIGIDPHRNHMLFHQISRSEIPKMTRALGAQS